MKPVDFVVILVIALIVGAASLYIYRAKKKGRGCIGCPDSATCQKYNESVKSGNLFWNSQAPVCMQ